MVTFIEKNKNSFMYRVVSCFVVIAFIFTSVMPASLSYAQNLPLPGTMVSLSTTGFTPTIIKGVNLNVENPLQFNFIIDQGDATLSEAAFKEESTKLVKYFLAALTIPEKEMWVNLSPYEKNRIIPEEFGKTEMGRDLLAQDYMLKQLTASLMYPEDELGAKFWERVKTKAKAQFGTEEIPMNTFNKIWIVPQTAEVYEHEKGAFIVDSYLKVMLEEDYIALEANKNSTKHGLGNIKEGDLNVITGVSAQVVKEILIPEIEKEVNEGQIFANLRQVYNSVILASWYKQALKESLLGEIYVDQHKTLGVEQADVSENQKIYDQYVEAFKQGVYDIIKEEYDPAVQQVSQKKYFSGGVGLRSIRTTRDGTAGAAMMAAQEVEGRSIEAVFELNGVKQPAAAMATSLADYPISFEADGYRFFDKTFDPEFSDFSYVRYTGTKIDQNTSGKQTITALFTLETAKRHAAASKADVSLKKKNIPILHFPIRFRLNGYEFSNKRKSPSDLDRAQYTGEKISPETEGAQTINEYFSYEEARRHASASVGAAMTVADIQASLIEVPMIVDGESSTLEEEQGLTGLIPSKLPHPTNDEEMVIENVTLKRRVNPGDYTVLSVIYKDAEGNAVPRRLRANEAVTKDTKRMVFSPWDDDNPGFDEKVKVSEFLAQRDIQGPYEGRMVRVFISGGETIYEKPLAEALVDGVEVAPGEEPGNYFQIERIKLQEPESEDALAAAMLSGAGLAFTILPGQQNRGAAIKEPVETPRQLLEIINAVSRGTYASLSDTGLFENNAQFFRLIFEGRGQTATSSGHLNYSLEYNLELDRFVLTFSGERTQRTTVRLRKNFFARALNDNAYADEQNVFHSGEGVARKLRGGVGYFVGLSEKTDDAVFKAARAIEDTIPGVEMELLEVDQGTNAVYIQLDARSMRERRNKAAVVGAEEALREALDEHFFERAEVFSDADAAITTVLPQARMIGLEKLTAADLDVIRLANEEGADGDIVAQKIQALREKVMATRNEDQMRENIARLENGEQIVFRAPVRLFDMLSSFDLFEFSGKHAEKNSNFDRFEQIAALAATISDIEGDDGLYAEIVITKGEAGKIGYLAPDYGVNDLFEMDAGLSLNKKGQVPEGPKGFANYVASLFGVDGINVSLRLSNPDLITQGGLEGSNAFQGAVLEAMRRLTASSLSDGDTYAIGVASALGPFADITGYQGALVGRHGNGTFYFLDGVGRDYKDRGASRPFPYGLIWEPLFENEEARQAVEERFFLGQLQSGEVGEDFKRTATLVNLFWTVAILLEHPRAIQLLQLQREAGEKYKVGIATGNIPLAQEGMELYEAYRDEMLLISLSEAFAAKYAHDHVDEGLEMTTLGAALYGYIFSEDSGEDKMAEQFASLRELYKEEEARELLLQRSMYSWDKDEETREVLKTLKAAALGGGAGGPSANYNFLVQEPGDVEKLQAQLGTALKNAAKPRIGTTPLMAYWADSNGKRIEDIPLDSSALQEINIEEIRALAVFNWDYPHFGDSSSEVVIESVDEISEGVLTEDIPQAVIEKMYVFDGITGDFDGDSRRATWKIPYKKNEDSEEEVKVVTLEPSENTGRLTIKVTNENDGGKVSPMSFVGSNTFKAFQEDLVRVLLAKQRALSAAMAESGKVKLFTEDKLTPGFYYLEYADGIREALGTWQLGTIKTGVAGGQIQEGSIEWLRGAVNGERKETTRRLKVDVDEESKTVTIDFDDAMTKREIGAWLTAAISLGIAIIALISSRDNDGSNAEELSALRANLQAITAQLQESKEMAQNGNMMALVWWIGNEKREDPTFTDARRDALIDSWVGMGLITAEQAEELKDAAKYRYEEHGQPSEGIRMMTEDQKSVLKTEIEAGYSRIKDKDNYTEEDIAAYKDEMEEEIHFAIPPQPEENLKELTELLNTKVEELRKGLEDQAMKTKGGIDMNPAMINMQVDGEGVVMPVTPEALRDLNIDGIVPVLINVQPIANLPLMLGLADTPEGETTTDLGQELEPVDKREILEQVSI